MINDDRVARFDCCGPKKKKKKFLLRGPGVVSRCVVSFAFLASEMNDIRTQKSRRKSGEEENVYPIDTSMSQCLCVRPRKFPGRSDRLNSFGSVASVVHSDPLRHRPSFVFVSCPPTGRKEVASSAALIC